MMTPQEVANCTFAKAVMGGYNMASVDDFLDKLTEDYTELHKENAALKGKMKVLVDKLEEYRGMEDAMRSTLLTAQKMASSMVAEAEAKRDALIADSAAAARQRLAEIQEEVAQEEQRLADVRREVEEKIQGEHHRLTVAQNELRDFIDAVQKVCSGQLELLERLPELPTQPEPAPVQEVPAAQEEDDDTLDSDTQKNIQDVLNAFAQEAAAQDADDSDEDDDPFAAVPLEGQDASATRILNLDDLQFGKNYTRD